MQNDCKMLNEIRKTTQMGCYGIKTVLPQSRNEALTEALHRQYSEYTRIYAEADRLLHLRGGREKNLNPMAKYAGAMTSMLRARTSSDPSAKIAEMMIQGNTRGMIKSIHNGRTLTPLDPKVSALSNRLLQIEQANVDQMKQYL